MRLPPSANTTFIARVRSEASSKARTASAKGMISVSKGETSMARAARKSTAQANSS